MPTQRRVKHARTVAEWDMRNDAMFRAHSLEAAIAKKECQIGICFIDLWCERKLGIERRIEQLVRSENGKDAEIQNLRQKIAMHMREWLKCHQITKTDEVDKSQTFTERAEMARKILDQRQCMLRVLRARTSAWMMIGKAVAVQHGD
jgi:hypothetical protein